MSWKQHLHFYCDCYETSFSRILHSSRWRQYIVGEGSRSTRGKPPTWPSYTCASPSPPPHLHLSITMIFMYGYKKSFLDRVLRPRPINSGGRGILKLSLIERSTEPAPRVTLELQAPKRLYYDLVPSTLSSRRIMTSNKLQLSSLHVFT